MPNGQVENGNTAFALAFAFFVCHWQPTARHVEPCHHLISFINFYQVKNDSLIVGKFVWNLVWEMKNMGQTKVWIWVTIDRFHLCDLRILCRPSCPVILGAYVRHNWQVSDVRWVNVFIVLTPNAKHVDHGDLLGFWISKDSIRCQQNYVCHSNFWQTLVGT